MTLGFTLIELVVVIAVIAILSAVSVAAYFGVINSSRQSVAEQEAREIGLAIQTEGMTVDGFKPTTESAKTNIKSAEWTNTGLKVTLTTGTDESSKKDYSDADVATLIDDMLHAMKETTHPTEASSTCSSLSSLKPNLKSDDNDGVFYTTRGTNEEVTVSKGTTFTVRAFAFIKDTTLIVWDFVDNKQVATGVASTNTGTTWTIATPTSLSLLKKGS